MKFHGYRRADGRAGIRNHVVVMPGVLCAAGVAQMIAERVKGSTYLYNPNGCAQNARDTKMTLDILSGMIANGNVYGALIVGLGCETLQKERYLAAIHQRTDKPVFHIYIQEEGGIEKTVAKGVRIASTLLAEAARCKREECDIAEIILGMECGGSDATSGLSSNIVLGYLSDRLVDLGATTVISETPEAIGAEQILARRGRTPEIGQKLYDTVKACEQLFFEAGEDIRKANPSPGNKAGGLTTLEEKSLGCIQKSGSRPFEAVYEYGEMIDKKGLVFLNTTAYDVASVAAKVAAGAQVIAFTTGRGTPVGNAIAPVIKITGNADTYARLADMLDFDTSASIKGTRTVAELGDELLNYLLRVCNGETVKAEQHKLSNMAINQLGSYC
ncbi:MAG: UxaA family hydrolase [Firmicutes bacterium]|jgi:altronate dehydratase large subunit|nr:UxaA family hydrolase [Bacillota bacterium]